MTTTDKPPAPRCSNCGAAMREWNELHGVMVHGCYECAACAILDLPMSLQWMLQANNPLNADATMSDVVVRYREVAHALVVAVMRANGARLVLGEAALATLKQAFAPCDLDRVLFYVVQAGVLERENLMVPVPPSRAQRRSGAASVPSVVLAVVLTPGPALRENLPALPVFAPRTVGET